MSSYDFEIHNSPERILENKVLFKRCKEIIVEARFWEWVDAFKANEEGEGWHSRRARGMVDAREGRREDVLVGYAWRRRVQ